MVVHNALEQIFGPPGTGKTTRCLAILEAELAAGAKPERTGFISFTTKAIEEARTRAAAKFGFSETQAKERLVYFRTIHSLAFRQMGLRRDEVIQWSHYRELGRLIGFEFKGRQSVDGTDYGMGKGDRMLFLEGLARQRQQPLLDVWREAREDDIPWFELEYVAKSLHEYKRTSGLLDFTDMLARYVNDPQARVPTLDVLIVDEAQDLTRMQWQVVAMLAAKARTVYIAGDDDQAIYRWAGADVETFLNLQAKRTVLGQSYRIPLSVHNVAAGIVARMTRRAEKVWKPREEVGSVSWAAQPDDVDLSAGTWLLLARNGYLLDTLEGLCRRQGYSYESVGKSPLTGNALKAIVSWEKMRKGQGVTKAEALNVLKYISPHRIPKHQRDGITKLGDRATVTWEGEQPIWHQALDLIDADDREYFIAVRRRGETLMKKPRIRISTIHTAKGGEADHVMLLTDMSERTQREMARNFDDEARVWYVAVTRARQSLHVVQPKNAANSFQVM